MANVKQLQINGTPYDIKDDVARGGLSDLIDIISGMKYAGAYVADGAAKKTLAIPFAKVDSTSTATAFTATVDGITELVDGTCVMLENGVVTSAAGFTLNVNGLGAKPAFSNLTAATRDTTIFNVNYTMLFVYDSNRVVDSITGAWCCYRGYDANTNTIGYQLRSNSYSKAMTDITYRYRLLFSSADNSKWVPANTSSSTNATASRTVCQTPINPFGEIVYYGKKDAVDAGASPDAATLWQQYTLSLGYSFNRTGAALELTSWKPVYVKCAPQANGSAIIDATTPYVQDLPNTDDGKIYIFLGVAYNATSIELLMNHPVFYYKDGAIRQWSNQYIPEVEAPIVFKGEIINSEFTFADITTFSEIYDVVADWDRNVPVIIRGYIDDESNTAYDFYYVESDKSSTGDINFVSFDSYNNQLIVLNVFSEGEDSLYAYIVRVALATTSDIPTALSDLSDDSTHRLVTDAQINTWNAKQDSLVNTQNPYTAQGTSTKVPTITTNNLGQVTTITETDIAFPTLSKGSTSGSGNAVTDISVSGHTITLTKGSTFGTYSKPSGGIPSTDLASAVQTSLGKADTSLQPDVDNDLGQGTISSSSNQGFDYIIADVDTSSEQTLQDALDAKASISAVNAKQDALVSGTNIKTVNNTSLLGSGNVSVGTITGITMNGSSKGTSGVVDLGTVLTAHQDISGKADKSDTYTKAEVNNLIPSIQQDIVVGALPASGTANTIYRVPSTNSYSDYGWDGTQFVLLATYDNAIDDVPTQGSDNLVKSGGVWEKTNIIDNLFEDDEHADFDISDENNNVLARFSDGNFRVKNFDSKDAISAEDGTPADVDISDKDGNVLARFSNGHIKTKYFNSANIVKYDDIIDYLDNSYHGGRFKYNDVSIHDYYAAYDELCDFRHIIVKETPIGYSTIPSGERALKDNNQYPINLYRIPNSTAKKRIVLMGAIHGDSQFSDANPTGDNWYGDNGDAQENILIPYYFVNDLIRHRKDNEYYKQLLAEYEIDIIPIINPWGVQNHSRRNGNNVDLNRNFDCLDSNGNSRWQAQTQGNKGNAPFSENETQAVVSYVNSHDDIELIIECHARGQVNLGGDYRFFAVYPANIPIETGIVSAVLDAKDKFGAGGGVHGYTRDEVPATFYAWAFFEKNIPAFEPELGQSIANRFLFSAKMSSSQRLNINDVYTITTTRTDYVVTFSVVASDGSDEIMVLGDTFALLYNGTYSHGGNNLTILSNTPIDAPSRHGKELLWCMFYYYRELLFNSINLL